MAEITCLSENLNVARLIVNKDDWYKKPLQECVVYDIAFPNGKDGYTALGGRPKEVKTVAIPFSWYIQMMSKNPNNPGSMWEKNGLLVVKELNYHEE